VLDRPFGSVNAFSRSLCALAALALFPTAALALDPSRGLHQYVQQVWQTGQGLPQNSVVSIVQGRDGYLWLATQEGVVRFDGSRFVVFDTTNTPALRNNNITALLESSAGVLWAGTTGGYVLHSDGSTFRAQTVGASGTRLTVQAMAEGRDGSVWFGTTVAGVNRVVGDTITSFTVKDGLPSNQVRAIGVDAGGTVWISTSDGLVCYTSGAFWRPAVADGMPTVTAIVGERDGTLWFGTTEGVRRFAHGILTALTTKDGLPHDLVNALYRDREGALWIGTNGGLARYSGGVVSSLTGADGLPSESIISILEDREGNLWVGSSGGGLLRLTESRAVTFTVRNGLKVADIYAIAGDADGALYAGSQKGDIYRMKDGQVVEVIPRPNPASDRVRAIYRDPDGTIWLGLTSGLYVYTHGRYTHYGPAEGLPNLTARAIARDRAGTLWVGTDGGGLFHLAKGRFEGMGTRDGLGSEEIRDILVARDGSLWVATYGGLTHLEEGRVKTYTTADGLVSNLCRALHEDAAGTLWIGTYGGGLSRLRDGRFASFTRADGLLTDGIFEVVEDDAGQLWMSSNKGIFAVKKADLDAFAEGRIHHLDIATLDESDGMKNRECNGGNPGGWRTPDGRLWFATIAGVVAVEPETSRTLRPAPPVGIEGLVVDGRAVDIAHAVELPPNPERLEFHYTAFAFAAPQKVRFSYRLEGFDRGWVDSGTQRTTYYTQLPPGRYRFLARAVYEGGAPATTSASVEVVVQPALYQTLSFRVGVVVSLALVGVALHLWRTRKLRNNERALENRVHEAMSEIKILSGLLPICADCKKIRDDHGEWNPIERYVHEHSEAEFSHGLCPECVRRRYPEFADQLLSAAGKDH
jgi:ligand-binding sensor domain-containing protein